jgi:hypothetical protein
VLSSPCKIVDARRNIKLNMPKPPTVKAPLLPRLATIRVHESNFKKLNAVLLVFDY